MSGNTYKTDNRSKSRLKFNPDKCETMRITYKQDTSKESYTLDPNGEVLKSVKSIKDLSITISYDLLWSDHIHDVVNKANRVLGVIKRVHGYKSYDRILFTIQISSQADPGVCCSSMVPFPSQGHRFARKSSKESVEAGPRPKEGRNALRGTLRIKKWSIVPDQIRTNNSLLFAGTIAFCSQERCGSQAEITTKSSSKIVKLSA